MHDHRKIKPETPALEDRLRVLSETLPECFSEGRLDPDKLRELLGDENLDSGPERYGLVWPGKKEARARAFKPSAMALRRAPGEGVDEETTKNLVIEGENLEVLRLLQKSYRGRVKMIYIDPPYNTGNDFVYDDKFAENPLDYEKRTGLRAEDGTALQSNRKSSGRYHSTWLSMMYPRLMLARELLAEDGVIFISIDDTEVGNLRMLIDEIFGEENFVSNIIWQKKYAKQNDNQWVCANHDHILLYARQKEIWRPYDLPRTEEQLKAYKNPDNDPRGDWQSVVYTCNKTRSERPNLFYQIKQPKTGKMISPDINRVWYCDPLTHEKNVREKRIWWGIDNEKEFPRLKVFLSEVKAGIVADSIWMRQEVGDNQDSKKEIMSLLGGSFFDTPKPHKLIKKMLSLSTEKTEGAIILDFFAGSGTTAQAVLELNEEDGGNRRFILVQMPEPTPEDSEARKAGYGTIAEITKERVRRVIKKLDEEKGKLGGRDRGFRVFKLAPTGFRKWTDYAGTSLEEYEKQLELHLAETEKEAVEEDLVAEILLREGFPLDSSVDRLSEGGLVVHRVSSPLSGHRLFVCLDEGLGKKLSVRAFERLGIAAEDVFVCRDEVLSDDAKLRIRELCALATV